MATPARSNASIVAVAPDSGSVIGDPEGELESGSKPLEVTDARRRAGDWPVSGALAFGRRRRSHGAKINE